MKSKKTMLILPVAVVALCAVALIGAGFAIDYTGTTENAENDVKSYYITVTPKNATNTSETYTNVFNTNICYDTLTDKDGSKYRLNATHSTNVIDHNSQKLLRLNSITLNFTQSNNSNFNLTVTAKDTQGQSLPTGKFYIGLNEDQDIRECSSGYSKALGSDTQSIKITLYYDVTHFTNGVAPEYTYVAVDNDNYIIPNPANNVTFTFTATATV